MTDKEKLDKLVAEIERRYDKIIVLPIGKDEQWEAIMGAKAATLHSLLSFIDSMQKEPESHKPKITVREATGKLKELIDNISEEGLKQARKQLEELTKECMYSKDNYTDEDRKVLCEGCEEECKYASNIPPVFDEGYWERLGEKPISEDLKEAAEEWDESLYRSDAFIAGANRKEQQLMANAVDGFVIEDIEEGNGDFLLSAEYLSKDIGLKDRQKVKVIVIKED